ncbi:MAG: iron-sulfur cluster assembly scaffold protein [Thermoguttaceae bacterium]|nr:iron-sulfur cluster assembly scaffold protein [Thermoguttaceae bacterium]
MGWDYSEKTKQLFLDAVHGKPGTHLGEIKDADGVGEHGSISCGDALKFSFRVEKNADPLKDRIVEARYLTFGCTSAIAASEALCCIIEERRVTPIEALKITNADIVDFLDGLPQQKIHCSVMGAEALQAAVADWARKRGVDLAALGIEIQIQDEDEGRIVCKCFGLTEPYLRRKIKELNLHTVEELTGAVKAGGACGTCRYAPGGLQDILDDIWGKEAAPAAAEPAKPVVQLTGLSRGSEPAKPVPPTEELSPYQRAKKIEHIIEEAIRPILRSDGGDIEIIDIKGDLVLVSLQGACAGCASATQTIQLLVEDQLRTQVSDKIRVVQV